jgi:dihydroorotase
MSSGSDSAPHPLVAKRGGAEGKGQPPAGVFTQPAVVALVLLALEEAIAGGIIQEEEVTQEKLEGFLSGFGRRFYKLPNVPAGKRIVLTRNGATIPESIKSGDGSLEVALSRAGAEVFSLAWGME